MKNLLYLILILNIACIDKKMPHNQDLKTISDKIQLYQSSGDEKFLNESYNLLNDNVEFKQKGITSNNKEIVYSLLMYMRKYSELENLTRNDANLDSRDKHLLLNFFKALQVHKVDSIKAKKIINNNIKLLRERINENPKDSLLLFDYFRMKIYSEGKENALKSIDSASVQKRFTEDFYNFILKDAVKDYPEEFVWE